MKADKNAISDFLFFQEDEITSSIVYAKLAHIVKDSENKKTLLQIAAEEKAHYEILKRHTGKEVAPNRWRIFKYYWLARILGLTFAIKLMEKEERDAQEVYARYPEYPELEKLGRDEEVHEQKLIGLINEEK